MPFEQSYFAINYADDAPIGSASMATLSPVLREIQRFSMATGMMINTAKSEVLTLSQHLPQDLPFELPLVRSTKYLGIQFSLLDDPSSTYLHGSTVMDKFHQRLQVLMRKVHHPLTFRLKCNQLLSSIIRYGAHVYAFNRSQAEKLFNAMKRHERGLKTRKFGNHKSS